MTAENYNKKQKQGYFKAYQHLSQLEKALRYIKKEGLLGLQISVLGSTTQFYLDKDIEFSKDLNAIKIYWKALLGDTFNFGSFYNPSIETVFIVGPLVSAFLNKINDKSLATLSSGPYGIFRGIGASEAQANRFLKLLGSGSYVLIIRGFEDEVEDYRKKIEQKEKG